MSLRFQCLEFKYNSLWDSLGPLCIWDFLSGTWGSTACGSGFTTLCGVSLSCLWDSPVITTSGILGVSLCVLPFSGSFFTWNALGEYWTPPGSSCSHACSPQCMDSVQNGLWACFSSLVALVLDLQGVPLSTSHFPSRQHTLCSYSFVHCPYDALLVRHVQRSAQGVTYFPSEEQFGGAYASRRVR